MVTTVYVHLTVEGDTLHVKLTCGALLPCKDRYEAVDHVHRTGFRAYLRAAWRGLRETPHTVLQAPVKLLVATKVALGLVWTHFAPYINTRRGFKYGALTSVREMGMAKSTRNDGQWDEIRKYRSILERQVMEATIEFLDKHGIDTSDFRLQVNQYFYSGPIHAGSGSIHTGAGDINAGDQQHNYFQPPGVK